MAEMGIVGKVGSSLMCSCAQEVVECSRALCRAPSLEILLGGQKGLHRPMASAQRQESPSGVEMAFPPSLTLRLLYPSSFLRRLRSQPRSLSPVTKDRYRWTEIPHRRWSSEERKIQGDRHIKINPLQLKDALQPSALLAPSASAHHHNNSFGASYESSQESLVRT